VVEPSREASASCHVVSDEFVRDLESSSLALLRCDDADFMQPIAWIMQLGSTLLQTFSAAPDAVSELQELADAAGLVFAYKQQGNLKQRLQVRRSAKVDGVSNLQALGASESEGFLDTSLEPKLCVALIATALDVFEAVALAAFDAWCDASGVPAREALQTFGDPNFLSDSTEPHGKCKSVLNLYHYFNDVECEEEPCREHADPGLITILCRSTNAGLQVRLPQRPGGLPGCRAHYEDSWLDIETAMDVCSHGHAGEGHESLGRSIVLLAIVGETLERLSGAKLAACQHRVARTRGPRFNMAYELRPRTNVWYAWPSLVSTPATVFQDADRESKQSKMLAAPGDCNEQLNRE